MIPYVIIEPIEIGPLVLQPFGLLVALGVIIGIRLATARSVRVGLDPASMTSFITCILVGGFVAAHVLDSIFYHPHEVLTRPWTLLVLWGGLSSFGGFIGATAGAFAWKYYTTRPAFELGSVAFHLPKRRDRPVTLMRYVDVVIAVFPVAWIFGRAGCAVVHDHPGARAASNSWLSVAYGAGPSSSFGPLQLRFGVEPRYDLGRLEMLFASVLAAAFAATWRRDSSRGWYVVAASVAYAPVRFALDFLRVGDPEGGDLRYASLTPAQWACIGLFGFGIWVAARIAHATGDAAKEAEG